MSKELIISSNSHETRVGVLEDDQLVEIYFQRANEYSLAGSIHKGRVTRVLPGMQSAFVDIGLDRDAFLYVSDFFEDNEEYDKIVTSVEDKVLRLEKGAPATPVVPEAVVEPPAEPEPEPMAEAAPPRPEAPYAAPPAAGGTPDDRRGRRSRRRRTRGRGFPESKYAQPGSGNGRQAEYAAPPAPREAPREEEEEDDFAVLPGESLAKYRQPGTSENEPEADDLQELETEADSAEPESPAEEPELAAEEPELAESATAEPEQDLEGPAPVVEEAGELPAPPVVEPEPAAQAATEEPGVAEPELEAALATEEEIEPAPPGEAEDFVLDSDAAEPDEGPESGEVETAEVALAAESDEAGEPVQAAEAPESGQAEGEPSEAAEAGEGGELGPEPARIPTSLTAALREQGGRYLHRASRRMRRKMRGGEDQPRQQVRPETKAPEPRPQPRSERPPAPSISDLLKEGREIIVQVAKEPLGQKGARITSHIALPGRYLVYMPTVDHIGVSRKIASDDERTRLKRILQSNRSGIPGGYIVRTAGEGKTEEELRNDMMFLYNLWLDMRQRAEKKAAPALIHHDLSLVERVLRDQVTSSFKNIWSDNEEVYESILGFVQRFQPALVSRVKLYTRPQPIFDAFNITPELEKALRPKVWLKSGGYIVINQTEALVAIDINTGKYVGKSNRLEDTIVKTNTDAIREIVRQIRLRDLGGIIVVDFIDMDERKNRQKVMQALEDAMRADRAPYKILQFNDFGLVAITRKRVKQSLERTLCSPCPYCEGSGYVKSPQTVIGEILQEARKVASAVEGPSVVLRVNPEVAKLLKSSDNDYLQEIEGILKCDVLVKSDPMLHQQNFDLA